MDSQVCVIEKPRFSAAPVYGAKYSASEGPEGVNGYLKSILCPFDVRDAFVPSPPFTPALPRPLEINITQVWKKDGAILMGIFTPASPNRVLKLFVYDGVAWGFLADINPDDPLYLNFRQYRTVSAGLQLRSAAQAAGVFTLAGVVNSARVNSIPPFTNPRLTFNNFVAFAVGPRSTVRQVPLEEGLAILWQPSGTNEYRIPETSAVTNLENQVVVLYEQASTGWATGAIGCPAGTGVDLFNSNNDASTLLPDPLWGKIAYDANITLTASATGGVLVELRAYIKLANATTWNVTSTNTLLKAVSLTLTAGEKTYIPIRTPPIERDGLFERFMIVYTSSVGGTVTVDLPTADCSLTCYDLYKDGFMQPADMFMISSVNVGQPISLSCALNYQVVPDSDISKYVPTQSSQESEILNDMAVAVLNDPYRGPRLHLPYKSYVAQVVNGTYDRICSGGAGYEAAMPSVKAKIMSLWKSIPENQREAILELGKGAGRLGLDIVGGLYPAAQPMTRAARSYLSAPADYSASDPRTEELKKEPGTLTWSGELRALSNSLNIPVIEATGALPDLLQEQMRRTREQAREVFETLPSVEENDNDEITVVGNETGVVRVIRRRAESTTERVADYECAAAPSPWDDYVKQDKFQPEAFKLGRVTKSTGVMPPPRWLNNGAVSRALEKYALFPIVPSAHAQHLESRLLRVVWSTTQPDTVAVGESRRRPQWYAIPSNPVSYDTRPILYIEGALPYDEDFFEALYYFAVDQKLIGSGSTFLYLPEAVSLKGGSWHLAAVMALLGLGRDIAFSGDVNFKTLELLPIGEADAKLNLCTQLKIPLVIRPLSAIEYETTYQKFGPARTVLMRPQEIVSGRNLLNPGGAMVNSISDALLAVGRLRPLEAPTYKEIDLDSWVQKQNPVKRKELESKGTLQSVYQESMSVVQKKAQITATIQQANKQIDEIVARNPAMNMNPVIDAFKRFFVNIEFSVLPTCNNLAALEQVAMGDPKSGKLGGVARQVHALNEMYKQQMSSRGNVMKGVPGAPGAGNSKSSRQKRNRKAKEATMAIQHVEPRIDPAAMLSQGFPSAVPMVDSSLTPSTMAPTAPQLLGTVAPPADPLGSLVTVTSRFGY